ncbi:MAG: thiol-disulfide oxidoreductase DCC family protein [Flammeovirgaceae bacterium]|nr:MAG: thiol-disulfide oxidoreductase DCC family protein [Flammeovirgaceae bacterium]
MGSLGAISQPPHTSVVLFDGVCNLCSGAVQFILKRDPEGTFRFASLQSEISKQLLANRGFEFSELNTLVLIKDQKIFTKSDAALEIARNLTGLWPLCYVFKIIPRVIRNPVYDWIARNRYRWFGKRETCWLPSVKWKDRFLDQ